MMGFDNEDSFIPSFSLASFVMSRLVLFAAALHVDNMACHVSLTATGLVGMFFNAKGFVLALQEAAAFLEELL